MLKMRLELLGDFEVLTAEDGEKGCTMAASEHPDIILMDLENARHGWLGGHAAGQGRKPVTSRSSHCPRMRSLGSAKRRSRRGAMSLTRSRSTLMGWLQLFGEFSLTGNDALGSDVRRRQRPG